MKTLEQHLTQHGSQRRLARAIGVEPSTVWRWTQGKSLPSSEHRRAIEAELGPVDWECEAIDLVAALRRSSLSSATVAAACGVSSANVYAWRSGTWLPSGETLPALRRLLDSTRCPDCGGEGGHAPGGVECLTIALAAARAEVDCLRRRLTV